MRTVLLTGFEPFGSDAVNPSGDAVLSVASRWAGPERLVVDVLPVTFAGAASRLADQLAAHDPDIVICVGLAGGRSKVSVERVGINLIDARIPDNSGDQPVDVPSLPGGPAAVFATLPVKAIVRDAADLGIPIESSLSAGSYVCNHVLVHAGAWAADHGRRAGFIHVPWAEGQAPHGEPELPLETIVAALEVAIRTSLDTAHDVAVPGGAIS
ncbi:pyroglutamyl-peptidase I [Microbacterium candidum]|uniref:Pyroglutamyl-peptidase I n=1 Tax=Microbacterium candidum TaxID=3041922 RepID=A0ABT7N375_9MICO|nr:pyroglutamyl-peptidase I [Microbacterium sp. ASV49]MDL9981120.1 pyroglutamyl-peptidase I [Microbacterium sp. ASV49]